MPKYSYRCDQCDHQFIIVHSINDPLPICEKCENNKFLTKLVNKVSIRTPRLEDVSSSPGRVGDLTKKTIEENKEILEDAKAQARSVTYDDVTNISD